MNDLNKEHGQKFRLSPNCSFKQLEIPCIYNKATDELYELTLDAYDFLIQLTNFSGPSNLIGSIWQENADAVELINYCLSEGILVPADTPLASQQLVVQHHRKHRGQSVPSAPDCRGRSSPRDRKYHNQSVPHEIPTLRYLELQVTDRCNLKCIHCYLGDPKGFDLEWDLTQRVIEDFVQMDGLCLLISGGEPLLYPHFWELNEMLDHLPIRSVLISNGTLIDEIEAKSLKVHEVQVSLDGLQDSHDSIRGPGSFQKALRAIELLQRAGKQVSAATVLNSLNVKEVTQLSRLVQELGIESWLVDFPAATGRMALHPELVPPFLDALNALDLSNNPGHYSAKGSWSCGAHYATVTPDGYLTKCGYYNTSHDKISLKKYSLSESWSQIPRIKINDLKCNCDYVEQCRGGCRFRAELYGDPLGPDPIQCQRYRRTNSEPPIIVRGQIS